MADWKAEPDSKARKKPCSTKVEATNAVIVTTAHARKRSARNRFCGQWKNKRMTHLPSDPVPFLQTCCRLRRGPPRAWNGLGGLWEVFCVTSCLHHVCLLIFFPSLRVLVLKNARISSRRLPLPSRPRQRPEAPPSPPAPTAEAEPDVAQMRSSSVERGSALWFHDCCCPKDMKTNVQCSHDVRGTCPGPSCLLPGRGGAEYQRTMRFIPLKRQVSIVFEELSGCCGLLSRGSQ